MVGIIRPSPLFLFLSGYSIWLRTQRTDNGPCRTVGISPAKASTMDWDELKRVSETCTIAGMKAMYEAGPANPFRFLYVCGETAERDQTAARDATKKPGMREKYNMMRVSQHAFFPPEYYSRAPSIFLAHIRSHAAKERKDNHPLTAHPYAGRV